MTSAVDRWMRKVERHHAQSETMRRAARQLSTDAWDDLSSHFAADPFRTDDPVLQRLLQEVTRETTITDVGGGGGRFALPLASYAAHVTVVEPSPAMVKQLNQGARAAGITQMALIQEPWETANVNASDIVLAAHVVYGVVDIEAFIRKVEAVSRDRVLVLAYFETPLAQMSPVWKRVHGEERIDLPALPELLAVLWELGIYPNLEMVNTAEPEAAPTQEAARALLRHFLFVAPDTETDLRLQLAMNVLLIDADGGVTIRDSRPRREALLSWRPHAQSCQ